MEEVAALDDSWPDIDGWSRGGEEQEYREDQRKFRSWKNLPIKLS